MLRRTGHCHSHLHGMLVAGGAQGRFQRSKAKTVAPTMGVDGGVVRPSARTLHKGEWSNERDGLVIFGGEADEVMCDPQVYCLRISVHGWKWEVVETCGDDSMPVPGKPAAKQQHAPWDNRWNFVCFPRHVCLTCVVNVSYRHV